MEEGFGGGGVVEGIGTASEVSVLLLDVKGETTECDIESSSGSILVTM